MSAEPTATHERQAVSLFQREIVKRALIDSLKKLDPRVQIRNPVMFVVEIGSVITTVTWLIQAFGGKPLGGGHEPAWYTFTIAFWLWLTVIFANMAEAFAEGRGRAQADTLRSMRKETVARMRDGSDEGRRRAHARRRRGRHGRRADPRRRHGDRGHRDGRRVGDHRRVGARDPRVRRRPQRRHRRHARHLRRDRRRNHPGAGPVLPGSHDRAGRGRRAAQDAERDRAEHPARGADADLRDRRRHAAPVRPVRRHVDLRDDADRAAGGADPHDDRRAALGDRHRRHGPARAPQRARALRPRRRGLRRRRRAAARQDRHDHDRQPPGLGVHPDAGRPRGRAGRGRPAVLARRRDARGPLDRRARQAVRDPRARHGSDQRRVRPVHRADAHERRRLRRSAAAQGRGRRDHRAGAARRRHAAARAAGPARPHRPRGRHAAGGRARQPGARRRLPQGHGQGGHERPLRPAARDGHQDRDGHRRQPPDRGQDRRGVRRRRLPRRSDSRAQARADPRGAGRGPAGRDDRATAPTTRPRSRRPTSAWR